MTPTDISTKHLKLEIPVLLYYIIHFKVKLYNKLHGYIFFFFEGDSGQYYNWNPVMEDAL